MALGTKKPVAPNCRRLEDFPEWVAAVETGRRLEAELQEVANEILRSGQGYTVSQSDRERRVRAGASDLLAKLTGRATRDRATSLEASPAADQQALDERRQAIEIAIATAATEKEHLRQKLVIQIYHTGGWEEEHFAARQRIARAIIELKSSVNDEQALCNEMHAAGALSSPMPGRRRWLNVSACGALPQAVRAMSLKGFVRCNEELLK